MYSGTVDQVTVRAPSDAKKNNNFICYFKGKGLLENKCDPWDRVTVVGGSHSPCNRSKAQATKIKKSLSDSQHKSS